MIHRIAVVDDDPSILDLLRVLLESEDYVVETFESASLALESIVAEPPDAAIVDLMMPEMDGLELLRALRDNARTMSVPILICSAYYENLMESEAELSQGSVLHLRKPFHVQQLLDLVEQMISTPRATKRASRLRGIKEISSGPGPAAAAFAA